MKALMLFIALISSFTFVSCDEKINSKEIEIFTTKVPSDAIANGAASYELTAKISPNASDAYQLITFKCTDGRFSGEGDKLSRQIRANSNGEATINWIVPAKAGTYFVSASIGKDSNVYKDEKSITLKENTPASITLVSDVTNFTTVVANGESIVPYNIIIQNSSARNVIVTTNEGSLTDGLLAESKSIQLKADNTGKATVQLKLSTSVTRYSIKASVADTVYNIQTFTPGRAYADNIIIEADKKNPKLGTTVALSIFLKRNVGKVSVGTPISVSAYQIIDGKEKNVGRFIGLSNAVTNENQTVSISFATDSGDFDSNLANPVIIKVSSQNVLPVFYQILLN
jgi:hypothetical protein